MPNKMVCIMGSPVGHSLSPKLHGFWIRKHALSGDYTAMEVPKENLAAMLDSLVNRGFAGCNLTMPLKERALSLMDEHDESCLISGAVNTVVIRDGKKTGFNSDGFGFMESLRGQHAGWNGARVAVLGAGGAARAIIAALKAAGAERFILSNRTQEKPLRIIKDLNLKNATVMEWENRSAAMKDATLLVNCTSLGMTGHPALEIDLSLLPEAAAVCDIVYRPLITPLLVEAQRRGHPVVTGLPMLLHQGRLGFRQWFGVDPAVTSDLYEEIAACAG